MTIRERALAALAARREAEAARVAVVEQREATLAAEKRADWLARFQAVLDKRGFDGVTATTEQLEVDGVTLAMRAMRDGDTLVALARCATCGAAEGDEYQYVRGLADFGAVLESYIPGWATYQCRLCRNRAYHEEEEAREAAYEAQCAQRRAERAAAPPPPEPTLEERLLGVLREFVQATAPVTGDE